MSIHYKFNTALQFDTVTFDGLHITLKELKKQIAQQKKIGKDYDLQVTNAQTKEVFKDDNELISKNSSLIVARVPVANQPKKPWERDGHNAPSKSDNSAETTLAKSIDLSSLDLTEEDKIKTMMSQSTSDYDPANYVRMRGYNQVGPVPPNYICFKCHQRGHWIKDCKINVEGDIKKSTGIPRSFMVPVDGPMVPGARLTPSGEFVAPSIDLQVYKEKKIEKPPFLAEKEAAVEDTPIPEDLQCSICKDLMQDAVMAPCCGNSFCDECIRNVLVESDDAECPECNEKDVSPDTLIPNRFVRNNVNNFKNKTGYTKRALVGKKTASPPRPSLPDFIPPTHLNASTAEQLNAAAVPLVNNRAKEEEPKCDTSADNSNNDEFLYDIAVEKERDKARDYRRGRNSPPILSDGYSSDSSSKSSKDSYDPSEDKEAKGSAIPSVTTKSQLNQRNFGIHGQERSGTPTVDERYDVYGPGPGMPLQGVIGLLPPGVNMPMGPFPPMGLPMPPPLYNPNFPPPMVGPGPMPPYMDGAPPPMAYPVRGQEDYRDRGRGDRGRPYRGRYPPAATPQTRISSLLPTQDNDEAFRAFERMLQEKEQRDKLKSRPPRGDSHSRSRSPRPRRSRSKSSSLVSNGRRRSYTPIKRSRSRSKSARRTRSPSTRARSRSYVSRSRSRSFSKSPAKKKLSPHRYASPHRSPSQRYDRVRDARDDSNYGWDRRGRRGGTYGRSRYYSPQRQYGSYSRYGSPSRAHSPDRDERGHSSRWAEKDRYRRRSRSRSKSRERDRVRGYRDGSRERDRRSASRSWARDRSPDDTHRHRDDRNGHSRRDDGLRRSNASADRRISPRRNRTKSPIVKSRERKSSPSAAKHKGSRSPIVEARNPSPVRLSRSREREQGPTVTRDGSPAPAPFAIDQNSSSVADSAEPVKMENSPARVNDDRQARNPSPSVTEKSLSKKDKKKDKEKKKKKKEKETVEEREARRKRRQEKREKKRIAELAKAEKSPLKESSSGTGHVNHSNEEVSEKCDPVPATIEQSPMEIANLAAPEPVAVVNPEQGTKVKQSADESVLPPASPMPVKKDTDDLREESDEGDELDLDTSYDNLPDTEPEVLAPMPEPSRWEMDDAEVRAPPTPMSKSASEVTSVTNEVIKRAENAIFKKAISALQPLKKKLSSSEKTRVVPNEKERIGEPHEKPKKMSAETDKKSDVKINEESKKKADSKMRNESAKKVESKSREEPVKNMSIAVEYGSDAKHKERRMVVKEHCEDVGKRSAADQPWDDPPKVADSASGRVYKEVKGKQDRRKPGNSIQITIPIAEKIATIKPTATDEEVKSPPGRVPAKDRLGLKVDKTEVTSVEHRGEKQLVHKVAVEKRSLSPPSEKESSPGEEVVKNKRSRKKSVEPRKRHRSSSETSNDSTKKRKKRSKHKKEKRIKKKIRKDESDSTSSSDSEVERKKSKKSKKKKKKSRH